MQKLRFTTALAALGLFAASHAASANPLSPNLDTAKAVSNPIIHVATHAGGGMGGGGHAMSMGGGPHGMGAGGIHNGAGGIHNFGLGHSPVIGNGGVSARHFHQGRRLGGAFIGFGYDYGNPYWYDNGSCYWNCRNAGYGPGYCQAYAYNFC